MYRTSYFPPLTCTYAPKDYHCNWLFAIECFFTGIVMGGFIAASMLRQVVPDHHG